MRLNIIHVYFGFFLLITILRGFMNFPMPAVAASGGTNITANAGVAVPIQVQASNEAAAPILNENEVPVLSEAEVNTLTDTVQSFRYSLPEYIGIMLIDMVALIGIFGAGFKKEIFFPLFWKVFLFIFCIVEGYVIYRSSWNSSFWVFLWSLAMILPAPYAIFGYGFTFRWAEYEKRRKDNDSD